MKESKKWLISTLIIIIVVLLLLGSVAYAVDPFMRYRKTDSPYLLKSRFSNAGILYNFDYDTVMIGSSLMQNFDMSEFGETLNCTAVKATIGSISLSEMNLLLSVALKSGNCKTVYYCTDLYLMINKREDDAMRFPEYLYDENVRNDYKYLLGYETWMRYLPMDVALTAADRAGVSLPSSILDSCNPDLLEAWGTNSKYKFGREYTIDNYIKQADKIAAPDTLEGLSDVMKSRVDECFSAFTDDSVEYVMFFPPYSVLYWELAKKNGYFDVYQQAKQYIVQCAEKHPNVTVYDFQCDDIITDLDNYKDPLHYSTDINLYMTDMFKKGSFIVTSETIDANIDRLNQLISTFENEEENSFLFD